MLGLKIKSYMDEKGIKQVFLSEKTGIKPQIISSILNGARKIEAEEYFKICEALSVELEFFFSECYRR